MDPPIMAINLSPALAKHASPMDLGRSHDGAPHEESSKPASGQDQHVLPPLDHKEGGAATTPCLLQQALALRLGLGRKPYRLNYSGCGGQVLLVMERTWRLAHLH